MSLFNSELGSISKIPGSEFFVIRYKKELHHYYSDMFSKLGKEYRIPDNSIEKMWYLNDCKETKILINSLADDNICFGYKKIVGISFSDSYNNYLESNKLHIMLSIESDENIIITYLEKITNKEELNHKNPNYFVFNTPIEMALNNNKFLVVSKLIDLLEKCNIKICDRFIHTILFKLQISEKEKLDNYSNIFFKIIDKFKDDASLLCIVSKIKNPIYLQKVLEISDKSLINYKMDGLSPLIISITCLNYENMKLFINFEYNAKDSNLDNLEHNSKDSNLDTLERDEKVDNLVNLEKVDNLKHIVKDSNLDHKTKFDNLESEKESGKENDILNKITSGRHKLNIGKNVPSLTIENFTIKDLVIKIMEIYKSHELLYENEDLINIIKYFNIPLDLNSEECGICLNTTINNIKLVCNHSFCKSCISTIQLFYNIKCPKCRCMTVREPLKIKIIIKSLDGTNEIYECYATDTSIKDIFKYIQNKHLGQKIKVLHEGKKFDKDDDTNIIKCGLRDNSIIYWLYEF